MNVNGIGAGYAVAGYETRKAERNCRIIFEIFMWRKKIKKK